MSIENQIEDKKGIHIRGSKSWLSNFPKNVTYINFINYYGYLSNRLYKFKVLLFSFTKKKL